MIFDDSFVIMFNRFLFFIFYNLIVRGEEDLNPFSLHKKYYLKDCC